MSCCETRTEISRAVESADARRRRAIVVLSGLGIANAMAVSLRQLGLIRHLPDLPLGNFHADAVTTSPQAYVFGFPDAPLAVASLTTNVALALSGGMNRTQKQPWIPLAAAAKATGEAGIATWYFVQMPAHLHTWCIYCVAGAAVNFAIAGLTIPEGRRAAARVRRGVTTGFVATAILGVAIWMLGVNHGRQDGTRERGTT